MPIVDELIAILGYDIKGQDKLRKFARGMDDAERKARTSARAFTGLGGAVSGALGGLAAGAGLKAAVTRFADFERSLARIRVTAGASAEATKQAGLSVQRMAQDFALPLDEAIRGLETLTSSGQSLDEAMKFLPSVLATAQASGAATSEIANTILKTTDALKLTAGQTQQALDIMAAGGKAGQFELKDMATYIPELANSFATLGYKGTEGLKTLIAVLQTVREDSGSAATAANNVGEIFGKIYSRETANNFKQFGVDLDAALAKSRAAGEGTVEAFVRISREALNGDLSKLPKLFTDEQFRNGMQSLITSQESFTKFIAALNSPDVNGSVMKDLGIILDGTASKIQNLTNSWDRFMTALGSTAAGPLGGAMDWATERLAYTEAIQEGLKREGLTDVSARNAKVLELQITFNEDELNRLARLGGFVPSSSRYSDADTRLSPLQVERRRLEKEREALDARKASIDKLQALRGTPGFEHKEREMARVGADIGDVNARINRAYPIDPDRHKPFIGSQAAPPMPLARPAAGAALPSPSADYNAQLQAVAAKVDGMNAHLVQMTGQAPVNATVTDARQDNRQFPVHQSNNINVNVQQAAQAPAAIGNAAAGALKSAVEAQPARMQSGPQP